MIFGVYSYKSFIIRIIFGNNPGSFGYPIYPRYPIYIATVLLDMSSGSSGTSGLIRSSGGRWVLLSRRRDVGFYSVVVGTSGGS